MGAIFSGGGAQNIQLCCAFFLIGGLEWPPEKHG